MKQVILQMILFTCCIANLYSQQHTIWQLGRKDLSSEEFALAPDGKDKFIISGFGDNKFVFYAGENISADFPYIIPDQQQNGQVFPTGQGSAEYNFLF